MPPRDFERGGCGTALGDVLVAEALGAAPAGTQAATFITSITRGGARAWQPVRIEQRIARRGGVHGSPRPWSMETPGMVLIYYLLSIIV